MKRADSLIGAGFLALSLFLLISAYRFPPGMGRLPGPGFFPAVIGGVMALLSLGLIWTARGRRGPAWKLDNKAALAVTVAMLAAFLLLWNTVPFALRSFLFVSLFLRYLGQPWRVSLAAGAALTAGVVLAFQYGLRVMLG